MKKLMFIVLLSTVGSLYSRYTVQKPTASNHLCLRTKAGTEHQIEKSLIALRRVLENQLFLEMLEDDSYKTLLDLYNQKAQRVELFLQDGTPVYFEAKHIPDLAQDQDFLDTLTQKSQDFVKAFAQELGYR